MPRVSRDKATPGGLPGVVVFWRVEGIFDGADKDF